METSVFGKKNTLALSNLEMVDAIFMLFPARKTRATQKRSVSRMRNFLPRKVTFLAYGGCALSTSGSQNLTVLPKIKTMFKVPLTPKFFLSRQKGPFCSDHIGEKIIVVRVFLDFLGIFNAPLWFTAELQGEWAESVCDVSRGSHFTWRDDERDCCCY